MPPNNNDFNMPPPPPRQNQGNSYSANLTNRWIPPQLSNVRWIPPPRPMTSNGGMAPPPVREYHAAWDRGVVNMERMGPPLPQARQPSSAVTTLEPREKRPHHETALTNANHYDPIKHPRVAVKAESVVDDGGNDKGIPKGEQNEIHIIFAVDYSGSMRTCDVQTRNGRISRWDAVFESINVLVDQQLKHDGGDVALVSLVIFNDEAQTLLERMPLLGNGEKVRNALKTACTWHTPRGGTGFAAGFQHAKDLAAKGNGSVMLVFLSDGRPGDLHPKPPAEGSIAMQSTFKRHGRHYPAAGVHIEAMKATFKDRFNLQLICLCSEGKPWLEYLQQRYDATFHMCDLVLDSDSVPARAAVSAVAKTEENDDDDEILEVKVKSHDTLIREKHNRAQASGNVFSIVATKQSSSILSTFQSISSTVTSMRNGVRNRPLQERQIKLENSTTPSQMIKFQATRMVLNGKGDGVKNAQGEKSDGRVVSISMQPFAQGGLRNVFRMTEAGLFGTISKVGKESRHEVRYAERLQFHLESSRCQARAEHYAKEFNWKVRASHGLELQPIKVIRAEVYRLKDPEHPGGYRYLGVEEEIKGSYEKWNCNNGFVLQVNTQQNQVAQAFSHFSYEHSKQQEMVVDIQGSGYTYTDPQLHSKGKEYGRADRGDTGFKDFFRTHNCNDICQHLGLTSRQGCESQG